jgi:hypothetical protein
MILYLKDPKNSTKKKTVTNHKHFQQVAGYKNQDTKTSSYINNEQTEKEIRKTPFTISSREKKLAISSMKEMKDIYTKTQERN